MLYVCPTPIGNLKDVTLRTLGVLKAADVIACEDTRHTQVLLREYGIVPRRLISFHEYNEEQRLEVLLPLLEEGKNVALVSDAGMPGLSDPGFRLVRACAQQGLPVTVLPGPSSASTAVVAAALPCERFAFLGFLARSREALLGQLERLEDTGLAAVAFESPRRLRSTLMVIAERWPTREMAVCRELTKMHEEILRGTAAEILVRLPARVRGEIVLVLTPSQSPRGTVPDQAEKALWEMLRLGMGTKRAAALVAGLSGLPTRLVYELALGLKQAEPGKSDQVRGRSAGLGETD